LPNVEGRGGGDTVHSKRQQIVEILKRKGSATVDELSESLGISSVTVRHHLDVLQSEGLIAEPVIEHRATAGRPLHKYTLTDTANKIFPKNYDGLASQLLDEIKSRHDAREVNVMFEDMGRRLAAEMPSPVAGETTKQRLNRIAGFLNQKGYLAHWKKSDEGITLHTCNCPYDGLVDKHPELCAMDASLIASLTETIPHCACRLVDQKKSCDYLLENF
jgi:predicted ArsR family transcriptional regulator